MSSSSRRPTTRWPSAASQRSRRARTCSSRSRPASRRQIDASTRRPAAGRLVKVGFNHRFHPGIARAVRARARASTASPCTSAPATATAAGPATSSEWRAQPELSGGGELIDQGMHLLDLATGCGTAAAARRAPADQFWDARSTTTRCSSSATATIAHVALVDAPRQLHRVEERVLARALLPRAQAQRRRARALVRPAALRIYRMRPELGPPDTRRDHLPGGGRSGSPSGSTSARRSARGPTNSRGLLGNLLDSARYAWTQVERAYAMGPFTDLGAGVAGASLG